jgi:chromosome segregation ATPase
MQDSFKQALEAQKSMEQAQRRLKFLNKEIQGSNQKLDQLAKAVDKEYLDVQELEGKKVIGFLRKMKKEKEEQLEKEKQEYLDAVLRYNQAVKEIELLEFERNVLLDKLLKRPEIEQQYRKELKKYEASLKAENSKLGEALRKIDQQIVNIHLKKKEILEAHTAGKKCLETFWLIEQHLNSDFRPDYAPNHGFVPPGWNPIEYFSQIGRLEKARSKLPEASKRLKWFIEQLGDVYSDPETFLGIKAHEFKRFSDYFFESYIADWRFRDRIKQLHEEISRIIRIIESTMEVLRNELQKEEDKSEVLEDEKTELIRMKLE